MASWYRMVEPLQQMKNPQLGIERGPTPWNPVEPECDVVGIHLGLDHLLFYAKYC